MGDKNSLVSMGRDLEDSFFAQEERLLIEKMQSLNKKKKTKEALAEVSGIRDDGILQKLLDLDIKPDIVAALAIVPLVEVAWADGTVDPKEREAVLQAAESHEIHKGDDEYQLLETWLKRRPEPQLLDAWTHYIGGLCKELTPEERTVLKNELLDHARLIAESSGGFLGLGNKVSKSEADVLEKLAKAFG